MQGQQNVPVEPDSYQESTGSKPWQGQQSDAYASDWDERRYEPATSSATPAQHSAYPVADIEDVPSQAALAARIYGENPTLPEKGAYGAQTPVPKKSVILSKFAPFHAAPKLPSSARPAQASGATYLTPSEVQAIGGSNPNLLMPNPSSLHVLCIVKAMVMLILQPRPPVCSNSGMMMEACASCMHALPTLALVAHASCPQLSFLQGCLSTLQ